MNHKISLWGLMMGILITIHSYGQNINKIEFFVDTDPGIGLATNVPISPILQKQINNLTFNVPVGSLSPGSHKLYIRARADDGKWSIVFEKTIQGATPLPTPAIVKAEYFINTDPGLGLGLNIPITAGQTSLSNVNFTIPSGSLTGGTDYLYIRTKDETGKWSEVLMKQLDNLVNPPASAIVKAEYFINTDPGFGLGVNIPVTAGQTTLANVNFTIPSASLTGGTDYLYVRTKDEKGRWSEPVMKQLDNLVSPAASAIVKAEYFINTDPGVGLGVNIPITAGQTSLNNVSFNIPSGSLTAGTDYLYVRTKDESGKWSEVLMKQLENVVTPPNSAIVKAEYFINTDPGFGSGVNIPITAGQTTLTNINLTIPSGSLTAGTDYLYVRTKDEAGKWSEVSMRQLENVIIPPTPAIVRAEYFINTDPGFGLGVNIPITAGQTTLTNVNFTIPSGSLTAGTDYLYVRTKDETGKWSEVFRKQLENVVVPPTPAIVKAEYFINTDPGFGLGVNIPVIAGQMSLSNVNFTIPSGSLTAGTDYVYVRTKDETGRWSEVFMKQLENVVAPTSAIIKAEYFINTDPGVGSGVNIPITAGQTTLSNINFTIPSGSLTAGVDYLYIRTKDESGKWSEVFMKQLENIAVPLAPAIVKAEYFINTDPGIGLGVNIPITTGQTSLDNVNFTIPSASLTVGTDYLYIRTKDETGKWSEPLMKQLDNLPSLTPAIVKAEYFVDTDPGLGSGINIPVIAGQTTLIGVNFNLNYGSLSNGVHSLWIRAKDEQGKWSVVATKRIVKAAPHIMADAAPNPVCLGAPIAINFVTNNTGSVTYTAFISNASGSFSEKIALGNLESSATNATINGVIPSYIAKGEYYKVRIESSNGVEGIESDYLTVNACMADCNQTLTLASSSDDYNGQYLLKQSNQPITATNIISGNANVIYKSAKSILLAPQNGAGFVVGGGAIFKAEIEGCPQ
ncbi:3-coathanger stack domain-containing protein [Emticicia fontis]